MIKVVNGRRMCIQNHNLFFMVYLCSVLIAKLVICCSNY